MATKSRNEYRKSKQRAVALTDEQWDKLERIFGKGMRGPAIADWIDNLPEPAKAEPAQS